jgi:ABC-type nickel/cobalt efflux system permease component RcnA
VPERLYPWLAVVSGLMIAGIGLVLFRRSYWGVEHAHAHGHHHDHPHDEVHDHAHHQHATASPVSVRDLLALGVSGGIVPCPAALVVLLSAFSIRRTGFGLFLIVAFSVGLAAVLIAIGLLIVYARQLVARFRGDGIFVTRWLPLTSAAVVTLLGLAIALQAVRTGLPGLSL